MTDTLMMSIPQAGRDLMGVQTHLGMAMCSNDCYIMYIWATATSVRFHNNLNRQRPRSVPFHRAYSAEIHVHTVARLRASKVNRVECRNSTTGAQSFMNWFVSIYSAFSGLNHSSRESKKVQTRYKCSSRHEGRARVSAQTPLIWYRYFDQITPTHSDLDVIRR